MDVSSAARLLGGDVSNRTTVLCPGPGHRARDRSLSVTFDPTAPDGFWVYSFAHDDWQTCRDHVRGRLGPNSFRVKGKPERLLRTRAPDWASVKRTELAASIWHDAKPIGGTLAALYLIRRGIILTDDALIGESLRFHPACPFRLDNAETTRLPALIAAVVNIHTGEFQAVHRTALQPDGSGKAQVPRLSNARKMLGNVRDGVVKLSPDGEVTHGLGIGEGLETSLSVLGNFGWRPMWATLSAVNLGKFPVLPGIDALTIFADHDATGTGTAAARECAGRWTREGRESAIWTPRDIGSDFNDLVGRVAAWPMQPQKR